MNENQGSTMYQAQSINEQQGHEKYRISSTAHENGEAYISEFFNTAEEAQIRFRELQEQEAWRNVNSDDLVTEYEWQHMQGTVAHTPIILSEIIYDNDNPVDLSSARYSELARITLAVDTEKPEGEQITVAPEFTREWTPPPQPFSVIETDTGELFLVVHEQEFDVAINYTDNPEALRTAIDRLRNGEDIIDRSTIDPNKPFDIEGEKHEICTQNEVRLGEIESETALKAFQSAFENLDDGKVVAAVTWEQLEQLEDNGVIPEIYEQKTAHDYLSAYKDSRNEAFSEISQHETEAHNGEASYRYWNQTDTAYSHLPAIEHLGITTPVGYDENLPQNHSDFEPNALTEIASFLDMDMAQMLRMPPKALEALLKETHVPLEALEMAQKFGQEDGRKTAEYENEQLALEAKEKDAFDRAIGEYYDDALEAVDLVLAAEALGMTVDEFTAEYEKRYGEPQAQIRIQELIADRENILETASLVIVDHDWLVENGGNYAEGIETINGDIHDSFDGMSAAFDADPVAFAENMNRIKEHNTLARQERENELNPLPEQLPPDDYFKDIAAEDYRTLQTWEHLEAFREAKGYNAAWTPIVAAELGIESPLTRAANYEEAARNATEYAGYQVNECNFTLSVEKNYLFLEHNGQGEFVAWGAEAIQAASIMNVEPEQVDVGNGRTESRFVVPEEDVWSVVRVAKDEGINVALDKGGTTGLYDAPEKEVPAPETTKTESARDYYIYEESAANVNLFVPHENNPDTAEYAKNFDLKALVSEIAELREEVNAIRNGDVSNLDKPNQELMQKWDNGEEIGTMIADKNAIYIDNMSKDTKEALTLTHADFERYEELSRTFLTPELSKELLDISAKMTQNAVCTWDEFYEMKERLQDMETLDATHGKQMREEPQETKRPAEKAERTEEHKEASEVVKNRLEEMKEALKQLGTTFADIENVRKEGGFKPGWSYHKAKELRVEIPNQAKKTPEQQKDEKPRYADVKAKAQEQMAKTEKSKTDRKKSDDARG